MYFEHEKPLNGLHDHGWHIITKCTYTYQQSASTPILKSCHVANQVDTVLYGTVVSVLLMVLWALGLTWDFRQTKAYKYRVPGPSLINLSSFSSLIITYKYLF